MLRRVIGEEVVLETELADEALWVVADVGQMEQVLLNLVVNARDAMPQGGHAAHRDAGSSTGPRHRAAPRAGVVELTVTDSGVGMTDDVRSRIFEPFFTTKGDAGTGLGLATRVRHRHPDGWRYRVRKRAGAGHELPGVAACRAPAAR